MIVRRERLVELLRPDGLGDLIDRTLGFGRRWGIFLFVARSFALVVVAVSTSV
jgi:hypothetical protein